MKPEHVVRIHQRLCPFCADKAHDHCASCEHGKWGRYSSNGCDDPDSVIDTAKPRVALVIKDTGSVPPERWHYPVGATGYDVYAPNYPALYSMIVQHCTANNVTPPSEQEVVDWICTNLTVSCYEQETKQPLVNRFVLGLPTPAPSCCGKK